MSTRAAERVLVTGGAGFVGLHLARRLLARGAEVVLLDDFSRGRADREFRALRDHVEVLSHDLRQPIPDGLVRGPVDHVYHLAAVVGVRRTLADPRTTLWTNLLAVLNLLDWARRARPWALFLSSTSEVADGAVRAGLSGLPVAEEVPFSLTEPRSPRVAYALSKFVAETLFLQEAAGVRVRVARFFNVYGPRMGAAHVIPQFINRALAGADPFEVFGPAQTRAFCHVDDAVAASVALMDLETAAPVVVNVGNDLEEIAALDLARRVFTVAGIDPRVAVLDPPTGSPQRRVPDVTALRRLTGYHPQVDLDTGLKTTFEWYAARHAEDQRGVG
ncbi:NAD-dependent epimerase/dehydratase family protein [Plantactinospora sp. KLBMP9567]|uniref:NAD-dependent epimerase/dehydratase family protein n=1 Tax=Plantactinospora sp. KLBMP9567 TaxID=3085900 RepID=UPI0029818B56|nr:NAD-dependent epimerase/dehydratase family protein [Plantactinospora sp. KLBMP9567]MDW5329536.1 NAD-dependent epimerase/dehydratase family protein [Plantactinospora sp. KLBMP9567]